jgi:hypothetical protein
MIFETAVRFKLYSMAAIAKIGDTQPMFRKA